MEIVDSYSESNQGTDLGYINSDIPELGQSFTGDGGVLNSAKFYLKKSGSPTGNCYAKIYAHSGTFGSGSIPTGAALAVSDAVDVSTIPSGSYTLVTFNFTGGNKITLNNGTKYIVVFANSNGASTTGILLGGDDTSPSHPGNMAYFDGFDWTPDSGTDCCFYVYKDDAGTTTNSERDSELHGITSAVSSRDMETTGSISSNSSRDAELSAKDSISSERDAESHGSDSAFSARDSETTGQASGNDNRDSELHGLNTANSNRGAEITGGVGPALSAAQVGDIVRLTWTYSP